jgi:hypothetical protein
MALKKGQSGNPGGRPKRNADIGAVARTHTKEALAVLLDIARSGKSESARVSAASALLDRGWRRPRQALEHTGADGGAIRHEDLSHLTDLELAAYAMLGALPPS